MRAIIIQAEERDRERLFAEESDRRELATTLFPWMFILPAFTWVVWYLLFLQHGRRYSVRPSIPGGQMPNQDPLFAHWVRHRMVGGETLVATLFDLARRDSLKIREEEPATDKARKKKQNDYFFEIKNAGGTGLRPFEHDLIEFVSTQAGDLEGFRISDMKRVAKKKRSVFQKWFRNWEKLFRQEAEAQDIYEPYPAGAMVLNVLVGLAVTIAGIVVCILTASPTGLPAVIPGALQMAFTGLLSRRTRHGQRLFQEWSEFRKYLRRREGAHLQLQESWDKPLIGAVSLELVKQFNRLLDESPHKPDSVVWFSALHGNTSGMTSLSASLQSMVTTVSSSTTAVTAGAVGAGASGGGGGGAG